MVSYLRRWWACTLTDCFKFHFKLTLFIRRKKVLVRGLEFREKVNQIKSCSIFFMCVLSSGLYLCPGRWESHPGAQWLRYQVDAGSPPEAQKWNCLWSPRVKVGHTFSSWNNRRLEGVTPTVGH